MEARWSDAQAIYLTPRGWHLKTNTSFLKLMKQQIDSPLVYFCAACSDMSDGENKKQRKTEQIK